MLIVGAGMAGLLAGHMLRRHSPVIVEAQSELPNNHAALLRFRTPKVQDATGIPFKRVVARKYVMTDMGLSDRPGLHENNEYSLKVTGEARDRSVLNLEAGERYIAPPDFIAQMARGLQIHYASRWDPCSTGDELQGFENLTGISSCPCVSTIPMPVLMKFVSWPEIPEFKHKSVSTATLWIHEPVCDLYQTIYYPSLGVPFYRASLTGNRLSLEYMSTPTDDEASTHAGIVLEHFGIKSRFQFVNAEFATPIVKSQYYGKLLPVDEAERKAFIMGMTDKFNIWSLGRFATWRQILLDDVVDDIKFIDRAITQKDQYHRRLHHHNS